MARREVLVGQRYQPVDSIAQWEVRELVKDAEGIIHARLVRLGDATQMKTLSVTALRDTRLFKLLPGPVEAA